MSQITIYIEDSLAARLRMTAEREGMSLSSWIARVVADRSSETWPPDILRMSGTWVEDDNLTRPEQGTDIPRVAL